LSAVEHPQLPLARSPDRTHVPSELVRTQKTFEAALALACQASGLEPKEIAYASDIDCGHFSRMLSGGAHFPLNKISEFCEIVGNTVLPEWIAYQIGHGIVLLKSEAERRAENAEKALADEREKVRLLTDVLKGRAA